MDELAALGRLSVTCAGDDVPPIEELDPTACHLAWTLELETAANRQEIEDVFIFVADGELRIQDAADPAPGAGRAAPTEENAAPPGPRHDVPPEEATTAVAAKATAAAATGKTARAATSPGASARAEATPNGVAEERGQSAGSQGGASIRVPSRRLDDLMDQLGELVIAQARLRRVARDLGDLALDATAEEIERLVTGLRDTTLSMRMVPISLAFAKFRRLLRDLSRELGKDVQLRTLGGETEVDKNVFDSLTEPLVHMVRNAVDHGIDDTADRLAAGKPAVGTITLAARQSGGEVLISVHDDGRGLDSERIRRRAADRGLIPEDQMMSEAEIRQLIFAPGFSTAETVSSVSGRGVGMDAVRRTVEGLRGTIEVTSTLGQGTEITMRLPLTLAIIEGLLVRVAGSPCVFPLSAVEECVDLPESHAEHPARAADETDPATDLAERGKPPRRKGPAPDRRQSLLRIRDELVPYLALDEHFGFPRTGKATGRRVIVVGGEGRRTGLVIDEIIGQHQTVIKPLSLYHRRIDGLAGCTILGDGTVAMILDPAAIVKRAQHGPRLAA
ncbi:MAG: chemotaxis protein CheA [Pseudomonadota bacterium]